MNLLSWLYTPAQNNEIFFAGVPVKLKIDLSYEKLDNYGIELSEHFKEKVECLHKDLDFLVIGSTIKSTPEESNIEVRLCLERCADIPIPMNSIRRSHFGMPRFWHLPIEYIELDPLYKDCLIGAILEEHSSKTVRTRKMLPHAKVQGTNPAYKLDSEYGDKFVLCMKGDKCRLSSGAMNLLNLKFKDSIDILESGSGLFIQKNLIGQGQFRVGINGTINDKFLKEKISSMFEREYQSIEYLSLSSNIAYLTNITKAICYKLEVVGEKKPKKELEEPRSITYSYKPRSLDYSSFERELRRTLGADNTGPF